MREQLSATAGSADETAIATLRAIQDRYSGLVYRSFLMGDEVVFEPVLEPEPGDTGMEILYAISPTKPGGSGGSLLLDGSVMIGFDDVGVLAFLSLDHFLECEALLWTLGDRQATNPSPLELTAMAVRRLPAASGPAVDWLTDGNQLICINAIWSEVFGHRSPSARAWTLDAALRADISEHLDRVDS